MNVKISKNMFEKARSFVMDHARPLERARFQYEFENGSKEAVIEQLKSFQNEDGGFGHGIEPDLWLPSSSPLATWAAGQILISIGADGSEPIVQSMMKYLVNTCHVDTGMWDTVLPENNHYPHAPWWHWHENVQKDWMFNPSIELAAFLIHWSSGNREAEEIGWNTIQKAVEYVMTVDEMDKHQVNNFQQFIKLIQPYSNAFDSKNDTPFHIVSEKILDLAEQCIDKDVSTWTDGYRSLPLDVIDNPNHPLCERLGSLIEQNLKFFIDQVTEEGVWDISWQWADYPDEFEMARKYWKGILVIERYKLLKAFNCLESAL